MTFDLDELERLANSEPEDGMGGDYILPIGEARAIFAELRAIRAVLKAVRDILATAVVTEGCDKGVVMLSQDGPTHSEVIGGKTIQVYDHDYFSPLGDALIAAWELASAAPKGTPCSPP